MKFKADFTNVSEGGFLPEGEYVCKVTKAELKQGNAAKYINWELTVGVGDQKGSKTYYITSLSVKALFKLREFMIACGLDVPKAVVDIDTDKILGRVVGIKVVPGTYVDKEGKTKNKTEISDVYEVVKTDKGWVKASQANVDLDASAESAAPPWATPDEDITEIEI